MLGFYFVCVNCCYVNVCLSYTIPSYYILKLISSSFSITNEHASVENCKQFLLLSNCLCLSVSERMITVHSTPVDLSSCTHSHTLVFVVSVGV